MKRMGVAMMVVLGLSGLAFGSPVFFDDFNSSSWTGWNIAGSGTVTNGGGYADISKGYDSWGYVFFDTQNAFSIEQGLNVDVIMMFPMYEPGYGDGLFYRPNMTLKDASDTTHVAVYSPFSYGSTSAPIKMQTLNAGVLADTHSTPEVGTSGWYLFDMDVYTDHANIKVLENGVTLRDQWSVAYDAMDSVKVGFSVACPGWWPGTRLLVDKVEINAIPEPVTLILLGLGALFGARRK